VKKESEMTTQTTSDLNSMTEQQIAQALQDIEVIFKLFGRQYINELGEQRYKDLKAEQDNRSARARYSYRYYDY
jgi:hypothetical protein